MAKPAAHRSPGVRIILGGVIICMILALIVEGIFIRYLFSTVNTLQENQATRAYVELLADSIGNLRMPLVADVVTGRQSIYEGRLSFPLSEKLQLFYNGVDDEYMLINGGNLDAAINELRSATTILQTQQKVEQAQACRRQVTLTFKATKPEIYGDRDGSAEVATKKLANGRTVHIFLDRLCHGNSDELLNVVKQVQSF